MDLFETASLLKYVFLVEHVGLSQPQAAVHGAAEQLVDLAALAWLDRHLASRGSSGVLGWAATATLVLYPAWVLVPGVAARLVLGVPLAFAWTMFWPIAKSRSLASMPGRAGAVNAVTTLRPPPPPNSLQRPGAVARPAQGHGRYRHRRLNSCPGNESCSGRVGESGAGKR